MKLIALFSLLLVAAAPLCAQQPTIHTDRPQSKALPLPKGDDMFHFAIFGDRTGGPPEGLKVLSQAVADSNMLDPDLVLTVGDLVNGYGGDNKWLTEMTEYRAIMDQLKMPWFPVAGNHDIYWRGPNRPPLEHEANFEKHFGPLWYWFEHKKCGFLVLFSDEGDTSKGIKDFTKPAQSQMSQKQLQWLEKSLKEMSSLKQVFVFLHHPRWRQKTYPGTNWDAVHETLVAAKNVKAVFAGHIHRLHYGGKRDGIEYFALGTTGGGIVGSYPGAGYVHHMNLVTVRPDSGYAISVLPVGEIIDPRLYTPEREDDIDLARKISPDILTPPLKISAEGQGGGLVEMALQNTASEDVEMNLVPVESKEEWFYAPDHLHVVLKPGETQRLSMTVVRTMKGFATGITPPTLDIATDYLSKGGIRVTLPPRQLVLAAGLSELPVSFFQSDKNKTAVFDGKSALRVDMAAGELPDGPFTLEAWIRPKTVQNSPFLAKTEQSEFGFNLASNVPGFHAFVGGKYYSAIAEQTIVPVDEWTHMAGVFTGEAIQLYVNGKLTASVPASGPRKTNGLPLYIGADTDAKSNPTGFFTGAIDEVRLSSTARYTADFAAPKERHSRDAATVHLFHMDKTLGGFVPSDSAGGRYAGSRGNVAFEVINAAE